MIFDFGMLRRSVSTLESQITKMQNELSGLCRQREAILSAPTSKEDLKSMLTDWVNAQGEKYQASLQETLARFTRNPRNVTARELDNVMSISGAAQPHGDAVRTQDVDQAMCALFGPLLNAALMEQVERMSWPANSMTRAQRSAEAAKLTDRIDVLEKDVKDLINAAEEAGINWNR